MKGIEPRPACHTFVVIFADPAQCLQIAVADIVLKLQELGGFDMELLAVVFFLVAVQLMTEY